MPRNPRVAHMTISPELLEHFVVLSDCVNLALKAAGNYTFRPSRLHAKLMRHHAEAFMHGPEDPEQLLVVSRAVQRMKVCAMKNDINDPDLLSSIAQSGLAFLMRPAGGRPMKDD